MEPSSNNNRTNSSTVFLRLLQKAVDVKPIELRALLLSFVYYFLILSAYYVIRPIRDDFGAAGGVENLPWMFNGTLVTMLVANTLFSALVARFSRRRDTERACLFCFSHSQPTMPLDIDSY